MQRPTTLVQRSATMEENGHKPLLHVEVTMERGYENYATAWTVQDNVKKWIRKHYARIKLGQEVTPNREDDAQTLFGDRGQTDPFAVELANYGLVQRIVFSGMTGDIHTDSYGIHKVDSVQLDVQVYYFEFDARVDKADEFVGELIGPEGATDCYYPLVFELPNVDFKDAWSCLVYADDLPSRLLRKLTRVMEMVNQPGLNIDLFNWNKIVLLHGPPGSGKSTLCRALAQKMSIRLGSKFSLTYLVEINGNSLLSKYFSESGKVISEMFEKIKRMAADKQHLFCVVIDEIETIAYKRDAKSAAGDCRDGMRATNQLLTALDQLRRQPNVIVFCTSNQYDVIDPAFLDRVDIKQYVPSPNSDAIYEILRTCFKEMIRCGSIDTSITPVRFETQSSNDEWQMIPSVEIPTIHETKIRLANEPNSVGHRLWKVARKLDGLSGRAVRRMPLLAIADYTWGKISLEDAIEALELCVKNDFATAKQGKSARSTNAVTVDHFKGPTPSAVVYM